jgi:16S rRNA (guanine1207-N2)-methyltransferase
MVDQYYTEKPKSKLVFHEIGVSFLGETFSLFGASSVFGAKKIDKGTSLLIQSMRIEDGQEVLDLGCGMGVVGIVAKKVFPECDVTFTDVNERALFVTKKNLKKERLSAEIVKSDCYDALSEKMFDVILCNVPQRAGREVCLKIIRDASQYLKEGGSLQIVAVHKKGGKRLREEMGTVFGNVETLGKKAYFQVYSSVLDSSGNE